jgi:DNA-binding winged helix-turn-helix (wHTH) protein/tetratricopeptide (TPR) repeat protein
MAEEPKVLYEFGPFRVDPDKHVLLREDEPVAITPKAFETLLVLIRHSRQVVSKDELMTALWPDAFVEEANLSQNIFRLRKALGDTSGDQRYIVTLPGRGYRFAAQVRTFTAQDEDLLIETRSRTRMVIEQSEETPAKDESALVVASPRRAVPKYLFAMGVAALLLLLGSLFFLRKPHRIVLGHADSVLIADFLNTTGDPVFNGTLRQGLTVQLEQSPVLTLLSEDRIQEALRQMGRPPDTPLTPAIAREICERTASGAVLEGSIVNLGNRYVVGLTAKNCRTGQVLDAEQVQAKKKEDVLDALSKIASSFRVRVGESLAAVQKHDMPLAEATTPSLEALNAYSAGWRAHDRTGSASALPFFKHAIDIDPNFAIAYAVLGRMYGNIGESENSAKNAAKAYELRDRASDREKFFITASYDAQVTGNLEKAQETCEAWAQTYPREVIPHTYLSGFIYPGSGHYERAIKESQTVIALDPDFAVGYINLGYGYISLDRLGEAENALRSASERRLAVPEFIVERYDLAFLKGDRAGMDREAALAQGSTGVEDWIAYHQAFALAYNGHLQEASRMAQRAVDLAQQGSHPERASLFEAGTATWEAFFGNAPASIKHAKAALELSSNREVVYGAAFALALSGDSKQAEVLANDLQTRFPEDTSVRFSYLPVLRAMIALNHGGRARAFELLKGAMPYELGTQRSSIHGNFGAFYPAYVRGDAYLSARQGNAAAMEFQKVINHRGIVLSDPAGAMARLQLGRAWAISGDMIKAKIAYQDFLTLWKDADPDVPLLKQAKKEYVQLQ